MLQTTMELAHLLFVVFVIISHTAPTTEAGILDPIRNMLSVVRSRPQSGQDLDKLFFRFRDNDETLDAIDPTDFDPKNPTITTNPDYPQIQFDYYQDQSYRPVDQTSILNKNIDSLIKSTSVKPKSPVECKPKEKKPPPERSKPLPKCPKPPPECPKPPPKPPKELVAKYRDKIKLYNNSRLSSVSPYKQKIPTIDPYDPNLNPDLVSNSKLPSDGPFDSELPFDGLPNSKLPSNGPYNLNLPSDGPYDSNLPSDRLSSSKILSDGYSYSRLPPVGPNISKLPNDDVSNSRWDTDEHNNNINDVDGTDESNNICPDENREVPATSSKKITQADYDHIIAQKFPTAVKLLENFRKLKKFKELDKMNENNEDNTINKKKYLSHNAGNDGNNENSKAMLQSPTVKFIININNDDNNALMQPEGVYMRITTSPSIDDDRPVMIKSIKRRFYYQARAVKPEN